MSTSIPGRLPHGRHGLSREEVERSQRDRLLLAAASAMSEKGYARTVVEDIVKRAGVSRETFYRMFRSKQDCFMAAFRRAGELLISHISARAEAGRAADDPVERFSALFEAYLDALATHATFARLFLVEVHAAGREAIEARLAQQTWFVDAIAEVFGVQTAQGRLACQMVVAATSAMVTGPLVSGDMDALRALGPQISSHVRALHEAGLLA
ncbi:TetR/AcrR family transcriptional regulator [Thermocrispum sp.]|uniref:TetR/AcrR family transcriptional regulator n=1 Tax=Thermocrispum sp. TaxID=2060768 RepID=UPI00257D1944|nr:TetR/AcrR family transcriptional regulator [Thermocrispum sp.]